jgi:hypothetical protein
MWFWDAAYHIVEQYNHPKDRDGPRHFEVGLGLMVSKLLQIITRVRGKESAALTCEHIERNCRAWRDHPIDDNQAAE